MPDAVPAPRPPVRWTPFVVGALAGLAAAFVVLERRADDEPIVARPLAPVAESDAWTVEGERRGKPLEAFPDPPGEGEVVSARYWVSLPAYDMEIRRRGPRVTLGIRGTDIQVAGGAWTAFAEGRITGDPRSFRRAVATIVWSCVGLRYRGSTDGVARLTFSDDGKDVVVAYLQGYEALHAPIADTYVKAYGRLAVGTKPPYGVVRGQIPWTARLAKLPPDAEVVVTGRVVTTEGDAVPDALVQLKGVDRTRVHADADGRFTLRHRGADAPWTQSVCAGAAGHRNGETVLFTGDPTEDVVVELAPLPPGDHVAYPWVHPAPDRDPDDVAACGTCHSWQYTEWLGSRHARFADHGHVLFERERMRRRRARGPRRLRGVPPAGVGRDVGERRVPAPGRAGGQPLRLLPQDLARRRRAQAGRVRVAGPRAARPGAHRPSGPHPPGLRARARRLLRLHGRVVQPGAVDVPPVRGLPPGRRAARAPQARHVRGMANLGRDPCRRALPIVPRLSHAGRCRGRGRQADRPVRVGVDAPGPGLGAQPCVPGDRSEPGGEGAGPRGHEGVRRGGRSLARRGRGDEPRCRPRDPDRHVDETRRGGDLGPPGHALARGRWRRAGRPRRRRRRPGRCEAGDWRRPPGRVFGWRRKGGDATPPDFYDPPAADALEDRRSAPRHAACASTRCSSPRATGPACRPRWRCGWSTDVARSAPARTRRPGTASPTIRRPRSSGRGSSDDRPPSAPCVSGGSPSALLGSGLRPDGLVGADSVGPAAEDARADDPRTHGRPRARSVGRAALRPRSRRSARRAGGPRPPRHGRRRVPRRDRPPPRRPRPWRSGGPRPNWWAASARAAGALADGPRAPPRRPRARGPPGGLARGRAGARGGGRPRAADRGRRRRTARAAAKAALLALGPDAVDPGEADRGRPRSLARPRRPGARRGRRGRAGGPRSGGRPDAVRRARARGRVRRRPRGGRARQGSGPRPAPAIDALAATVRARRGDARTSALEALVAMGAAARAALVTLAASPDAAVSAEAATEALARQR